MVKKNSGVVGTWYQDRYPGARVNTPGCGCTDRFGVDVPFANAYGACAANRNDYDWVADEFNLRGGITLDTEVRSPT